MLSFEWNEDLEQLEIHTDSTGLLELKKHLDNLIYSDDYEHVHLMTENWGGTELTNNQQNNETKLIHHVKIFKWK